MAGFGSYGVPAITRVDGGSLLDTPALLGQTLAELAAADGAALFVLPTMIWAPPWPR
jgi:hypothetical protein